MIVIAILIGIVVLFGVIGLRYFKPNKLLILNFIKKNPDRASIKLVRNDTVLAQVNSNRLMPLASTVKIILAIEYAEQSAKGLINPDEQISLAELNKYFVPDTDGGAHPRWLKSVKDEIVDGHISIRELAKGMIEYSSNANTEWLCEKLGLENINKRIGSLGVKNHSEIYYIVSALFVGKEKFPELIGKELATRLKELSIETYIEAAYQIHEKLKIDTTYKEDIGDLGMPIQRIWSNNLPYSTVAEYVGIMKKINSRKYFDQKTQNYLDEVMEYLLKNPTNRKWLEHSGMKGGSTAFVLTKSLYATDKKGNKTELAYFFNNLGIIENTRLQTSMNEFELKILTDKDFREKIKIELGKES